MKISMGCLLSCFILIMLGSSLPTPVAADEIETILTQVNLDSLLKSVRELSGEAPVRINDREVTITSRHSNEPGNALAAAYLQQKLSARGLLTSLQDVVYNGLGQNVLAVQRGYRFPDDKIIICAHYDCMPSGPLSYGADDNASGTAAVLEAARLLAGKQVPYTILYALWDQEEQGLIGSKQYANLAAANNESILGVINLDMIAWDGDNNLTADLQVRDIGNTLYLAERMNEINDNYQTGLSLFQVMPGSGASDHAPFWNAGYGALFLIENFTKHSGVRDFNPYYHTLRDRIYLDGKTVFNFEFFTRCTRLAIATLTSYAMDLAPATPDVPILASARPVRTEMNWHPVPGATSYGFEVAKDDLFSSLDYRLETADTLVYLSGLHFNDFYYLRIRARNRAGSSIWSETGTFSTLGPSQKIFALNKGWNLVSAGVIPIDSSLMNLAANASGKLDIVRDGQGRLNWPARDIYEIMEWHSDQAYWVHASDTTRFTLTGVPINTIPSPMPLRAGWNNLAYWPDQPLPVSSALATLDDRFAIVKNGTGDIYWPARNLDQIGNLTPDRGYQIYLSAPDTLTFPFTMPESGQVTRLDPPAQPRHFDPIKNTGANAILLVESAQFADGDEIGVRSVNGTMIGGAVSQDGRCLITLWGDDMATPDIEDGALEGDILTLICWSFKHDEEVELAVEQITDELTNRSYSPPLHYRTDAVDVVRVTMASASPATYALAQNYPNPFNERTRLDYALPEDTHVRLRIFNLHGQVVRTCVDEEKRSGYYSERFFTGELSSGLYWAVLEAGERREQVKMVVVR